MPREKLVADLELPLDHLGEIDACDMSFRQFLKTVELRTVLARLPVRPCRADEGVDLLNRIVGLDLRLQIGIRGGEIFSAFFAIPSGGIGFLGGFFVGKCRQEKERTQ